MTFLFNVYKVVFFIFVTFYYVFNFKKNSNMNVFMPRPWGIKQWSCLTSDVCLSDVCCVHPVGGRRVRRAGWMARIGWSCTARPAWLKAAAARFRCRPGWGISWRPPAYSLFTSKMIAVLQGIYRRCSRRILVVTVTVTSRRIDSIQ